MGLSKKSNKNRVLSLKNTKRQYPYFNRYNPYFDWSLLITAAWAAANRAKGTRYGEQDR